MSTPRPHQSWIDISDDHSKILRPRAPTPSATSPAVDNPDWSPVNQWPPRSSSHTHLTRSLSEPESSFLPVSSSFIRPSKSLALPDPALFPVPYAFRYHPLPDPVPSVALSPRGSLSAAPVPVPVPVPVPPDDESSIGLGITSDSVVQLLNGDPASSLKSRAPIDPSRWSEPYSVRSRSSSLAVVPNGVADSQVQKLHKKPSYDMTWQSVDERDEDAMSEEDTDEDHVDEEDDVPDTDEKEEERTAAVVMAEEGRGLIVQAEGLPILQLNVQPGAFLLFCFFSLLAFFSLSGSSVRLIQAQPIS